MHCASCTGCCATPFRRACASNGDGNLHRQSRLKQRRLRADLARVWPTGRVELAKPSNSWRGIAMAVRHCNAQRSFRMSKRCGDLVPPNHAFVLVGASRGGCRRVGKRSRKWSGPSQNLMRAESDNRYNGLQRKQIRKEKIGGQGLQRRPPG